MEDVVGFSEVGGGYLGLEVWCSYPNLISVKDCEQILHTILPIFILDKNIPCNKGHISYVPNLRLTGWMHAEMSVK